MSSSHCIICHVPYTSEDIIYSTDCGHTFHEKCKNNWFRYVLFSHCPVCEQCDATAHRLFINFDSEFDDLKKISIQFSESKKWEDNLKDKEILLDNHLLKFQLIHRQDIKKLRNINESFESLRATIEHKSLELSVISMDVRDLRVQLELCKEHGTQLLSDKANSLEQKLQQLTEQ